MTPRGVNLTLTITSLLSILLFSLHVTDDIVHGYEKGRAENLPAVLIFVTWLYGTLMLAERRLGYVIMLLGGLLSMGVPILHIGMGKGVGAVAKADGGFFFVWTIIALGVTGFFSVILVAHAWWALRKGRASVA